MNGRRITALALAPIALAAGGQAWGQAPLTAGAAKVDITPPESALAPGDRILDHLYARAIVIAAGKQCAVLVGVDQGGVRDEVAKPAITSAAEASGCPADNIVISATHTHSGSTGGLGGRGEPNGKRVEDAIVAAVKGAKSAMRPARLGYNTTEVYLNVNRDLFDDGRWVQGPNVGGKSDKTLAVIDLLDEKGFPIGVYMNYAMHPVDFYLSGTISGDYAGAASRYIEQRYGPNMVAIFAQGASGDQNPRLQRPERQLIRVRTHSSQPEDMSLTAPRPWVVSASQRNAVNQATDQMKNPVLPAERAAYEAAITNTVQIADAMGAIVGESALQAIVDQPHLAGTAEIGGASEAFQCPGRDRTDQADPVREGALPPYRDGVPVNLRVGALRLGDIYIATVNGEVYGDIATRLKREAPVRKLMMTTLANGAANSGYIYSNEATTRLTFQVIGSRLKAGCAEDGIVKAGLKLIDQVSR